VAGADLGGLAFGSVLISLVMARWNRRVLAITGLLLAITANALCIQFQAYEEVLWLRFLSGTGSGIYTAVAVATLGASSRPARAYNIMLFAFAFSQAGEMQLLPTLSMNGIYLTFIIAYAITLPFLKWIPAHAAKPGETHTETVIGTVHAGYPQVPSFLPWMCLAAIFLTNVNIGAYWTYIELASLDAGIEAGWVSRLLVIVSLGSFVGCLIAVTISNRWGLARPLLMSLALMAGIVGILGIQIDYTTLLISLGVFNLLWVFIDVYQMATIAVLNRSGSFAALLPGAQGLGQITGPNIAASMLAAEFQYSAVFIMCAIATASGMLVYAIMHGCLRRKAPELVEV
jgi:predicted MFS family arabinose efflux permease